ncbi:MAG TPA: polysaccharide biosynthesis C-terminal domain-containing protein, partial [Syntrophales bacterium]|nr:polysaccharide biosynthesis C-terminal domain-containing protein [Syntrophales bacterium]
IDKVYLNSIISLNAVGLYSAGVNIANQYSFLSRPVMTTIKPEISKRLDSGDEGVQGDIKDAFLIFFQISLFLYLLMSLFSKEIVQLLMNERFHECYRIVPIFLLGIIIAEVTGIFQLKFVYKNQTVWFPITLFCSALLNVALNYFLIPFLDIYGAALSKTLTEMGLFVLTYIIAQRLHKTEYELMTNVWPLLIVIAITYISDNLTVPPLNLFIFKVGASCLYGFSLDFFLLRVSKRYGEVRKMFMGFVSVNLKRL